MLPSLHDDFLVSYEVNCETRQTRGISIISNAAHLAGGNRINSAR
jgi:hypothetical protein